MFEIRIHSRGGQGGVTAARIIALAAIRDGKYATAFPFYGAERRGAPVVSFVRIDNKPVKVYSRIRQPDLVFVLDTGVMDPVDVLHGLKPEGTVVTNSAHRHDFTGFRSYNIDLTGIALKEDLVVAGGPILDTAVVGVLAKLGIITIESARKAIAEMFTDERDIKAADDAFREMVV
jgi:pyruvate ferredoxin oxidoreductase gamma subunit